MTAQAWLLFCATETVLCLAPGPAVLLVVSLALARGARPALKAAFGILAANAFYFILSATGIGAALLASHQLFVAIKWAGAAYLVWTGARMALSPGEDLAPAGGPAPASSPRRRLAPFAQGLVTQGANPKALVFFSALLPQFIDPAGPVPSQVTILGISSIVIELVVLAIYIAVCRRARSLIGRAGPSAALNRVGGLLLIGAGAGLAAARRA